MKPRGKIQGKIYGQGEITTTSRMRQWHRVGTALSHRRNMLESRSVARRILSKAKRVEV